MDTFDIKNRKIKTFDQFLSTAEKVNKEDKKEHEIVKDGYSGDKDGKAGVEVLDTRKEEKGKHDTVKDVYSGGEKGKAGIATLDEGLNDKPYGLSKEETQKVAETLAAAISKVDNGKCTVNLKTLEEDSFDLDFNGEEFDGGTYNIYDDGSVKNMAMNGTNYGTIKSTEEDFIKIISKLPKKK